MNIDLEKFKFAPKISSGVILLSFLLPFFVIKCGNIELAKPTGIQLVTGKSSITETSKSSESKDLKPQPFAIVALFMAVLATILAWIKIKNHNMIALVIASVGFLSLIILLINMKSIVVDSAGSDSQNVAKMITVSGAIGYYLCLLGYLVYGSFYGLTIKQEKDAQTRENADSVIEELDEEPT